MTARLCSVPGCDRRAYGMHRMCTRCRMVERVKRNAYNARQRAHRTDETFRPADCDGVQSVADSHAR